MFVSSGVEYCSETCGKAKECRFDDCPYEFRAIQAHIKESAGRLDPGSRTPGREERERKVREILEQAPEMLRLPEVYQDQLVQFSLQIVPGSANVGSMAQTYDQELEAELARYQEAMTEIAWIVSECADPMLYWKRYAAIKEIIESLGIEIPQLPFEN